MFISEYIHTVASLFYDLHEPQPQSQMWECSMNIYELSSSKNIDNQIESFQSVDLLQSTAEVLWTKATQIER